MEEKNNKKEIKIDRNIFKKDDNTTEINNIQQTNSKKEIKIDHNIFKKEDDTITKNNNIQQDEKKKELFIKKLFLRFKPKDEPFEVPDIMIISGIACFFVFIGHYNLYLFIGTAIFLFIQYCFLCHNADYALENIVKERERANLYEKELNELDSETLRKEIQNLKQQRDSLTETISQQNEELTKIIREIEVEKAAAKAETELAISQKHELVKKEATKVSKIRELYKSIKYCIDNFFLYEPTATLLKVTPDDLEEVNSLVPSVMLHLQYMNSKELNKAFKDNDKQIEKILNQFSARYTTKANQAIYSLMVIALRAELQNILSELKYDKLDNSIANIKKTTLKYLKIAGDGNQNIAGTLTKFIGQLEYLFINAAKIEYHYYIKKEKERQEQLALKEKMRQEAAERKALEIERKKIEDEESKYTTEISKIKAQLETAQDDEITILNKRILELQEQLSNVQLKKEDIINLQNGKAGTVYVISNLGSFGEDVFKIGMTRRLNPQDRVNELGSASVPFKFDVHSFIFSEDAVALENKIHETLNTKRINKVNLRKEFFKVSLDDLEQLVYQIEPTAEFNKTMLASEYRASIDTDDCFISNESMELDDDELEFSY